jgi:hypothetical protein
VTGGSLLVGRGRTDSVCLLIKTDEEDDCVCE